MRAKFSFYPSSFFFDDSDKDKILYWSGGHFDPCFYCRSQNLILCSRCVQKLIRNFINIFDIQSNKYGSYNEHNYDLLELIYHRHGLTDVLDDRVR